MKGPWYWNPIYNEIDEAETKMIGTTFLFLFYFISCRFQLKIKDNLTHKMCTRESTILLFYYIIIIIIKSEPIFNIMQVAANIWPLNMSPKKNFANIFGCGYMI